MALLQRFTMHSLLFSFLVLHLSTFTHHVTSKPTENSLPGHSLNHGRLHKSGHSPRRDASRRLNSMALPIQTEFKLPSSLPSWPPGGGFASGTIDLGGLEVCQITSFTQIWATHEGGPDNVGATFFEPSAVPEGFFMLGSYSQSNNLPLFGWILIGKDTTNDPSGGSLKNPINYTLVWSSENAGIKQDGVGYIWLPVPPDGYKAIGHVVTTSPQKPSLDKIRCVRADFTDVYESDSWIWGLGKEIDPNGINIYSSRPKDRATQALGVATGAFIAQNNGAALAASLACLKNAKANFSALPNSNQIQALIQEYSPFIYFHPDEEFFPSSVTWFFQNGALLYTKGQESNPVTIDPTGSNLPQGGSNDGAYWLDLPIDNAAKDRVKRGDPKNACIYFHIKPMFGATFTDLALWIFYPFNGAGKAKVESINISLGKIGEHVGDWEHVTLRVSNFNGELRKVYFSQHSGGEWVSAQNLEFQSGNKFVVFASLHGHAAYAKPGLVLEGSGNVGIRNDAAKGNVFIDAGANFSVISAEYLGSLVVEPPWLNYAREWGPKIDYDLDEEIRRVKKVLPWKLKSLFDKLMRKIPREALGEEGPVGPKWKDNWNGDERI